MRLRNQGKKFLRKARFVFTPHKYGNRYIRSSSLIGLPNVHSWETRTTQFVLIDSRHREYSFRNNHLFDAQRNLIYEDKVSLNPRKIRLQPTTHIEGTVAYLCNTAVDNYYHWLCLTLPLVGVYRQVLGHDADFYYIGNAGLPPWQVESLRVAGVSPDRLITRAVTAARLLALIPNRKGPVDESFLRFTRELFYSSVHKERLPKRLYVGRGKTSKRPFLNEEECMHLLQSEFGFHCATMDHRTIREQADLFQSAEVIVAPHGAALTNLLFASPRAKVIELMPNGYENPCFRDIAAFVGCQFHRIEGEEVKNEQDLRSLVLDIRKLRQFLLDMDGLPTS